MMRDNRKNDCALLTTDYSYAQSGQLSSDRELKLKLFLQYLFRPSRKLLKASATRTPIRSFTRHDPGLTLLKVK